VTDTTPPVHLRLRGMRDKTAERRALRAVLDATHLFGLAVGTHLRKLRELDVP
jgi:hypothetical protein